jgi:predicted peptidase
VIRKVCAGIGLGRCGLIAIAVTICQPASADDYFGFTDFSLKSGPTTLLPGRLYVPPGALSDPGTPRPLVLFLHGGGDAGTDNMRQINQNIVQLFEEVERRGAFLYAPQAPLNWRPRTITDRVMTMIDRSLQDYNVDGDRLYLTGYSSGGGGVWNVLSRYPDRFAAAVPVAPVSAEPDFTPANLVGQPIAAFHARDDAVASVHTTRGIIDRILSAANQPLPAYPLRGTSDFIHSVPDLDLHYIEPASGGHSVLFSVYNQPLLYDWMFAHGVEIPEPTTFALLLLIWVCGPTRQRNVGTKRNPQVRLIAQRVPTRPHLHETLKSAHV